MTSGSTDPSVDASASTMPKVSDWPTRSRPMPTSTEPQPHAAPNMKTSKKTAVPAREPAAAVDELRSDR
jgi:hypothetical protein